MIKLLTSLKLSHFLNIFINQFSPNGFTSFKKIKMERIKLKIVNNIYFSIYQVVQVLELSLKKTVLLVSYAITGKWRTFNSNKVLFNKLANKLN